MNAPFLADASVEACLRAVYKLQKVDDFIITVTRELPKLFPAEQTAFSELNLKEQRWTAVLDTVEAQLHTDRNRHIFDAHAAEHPLVTYFAREDAGAVAKITDFMTHDEWKRTAIFKEFYAEIGDVHQMILKLHRSPQTIITMAFNRLGHDFSDAECALLADLQPHLAQAYTNSIKYSHTLARLDTHNRILNWLEKGVVELYSDYRIAFRTPLASQYLEEFFGNGAAKADHLPDFIEDWVRAYIGGDDPSQNCVPAELRHETASGRLSMRVLPGTREDRLTVVFDHPFTGGSSEALRPLGLSRREADVLYWLAQGKSNPEIAIILGISAPTVKKHIESIFKALDVGNRTAAALAAIHFLNENP